MMSFLRMLNLEQVDKRFQSEAIAGASENHLIFNIYIFNEFQKKELNCWILNLVDNMNEAH